MIIDWTKGAGQQVCTFLQKSVWNWSGVSAVDVPDVAEVSERFDLAGTDDTRLSLVGTLNTRLSLTGTDNTRLALKGSQ